MIKALRHTFEEIGRRELHKHAKHFERSDREMLERYTRSLISKLLHHPTVCIKDLDRSTADGIAKLSAVRDLFQLPEVDQTDTSNEPDDRGRS